MARGKSEPAIVIGDNGSPVAGTVDGAANGTDNSSGATVLADGTIVIDPASIGDAVGSVDGSEPRKRRGRRPGSTNRPRPEKGPALDITGLEFILLNMHEMLAGITKTAELELDKEEANKLAVSIGNVGRHYNMSMSAKAVDWTALVMVIGSVYGTRLAAIRIRRMMERGNNARQTNAAPQQPKAAEQPKAPNPPPYNGAAIKRTISIPGVGVVEVPHDA